MKKFELTPAGVQALLSYLYQLPDAELQEKANEMATDFKGQVAGYFFLNPAQVAFLLSIDPQTAAFTASALSIAFANRLPVKLEKPETKGSKEDPPVKVIEPKPKVVASYAANGTVTATGEVTVVIRYEN